MSVIICWKTGVGGFIGTFIQNFGASALSFLVMPAIHDISFTYLVVSCHTGIVIPYFSMFLNISFLVSDFEQL